MPQVTKNFNPSFTSKKSVNDVVKLAKLDDTITIRIADYPAYYGQHWLNIEGKKKPVNCPRINTSDAGNPEYCGYCEDFANGDKDMKATVKFVFPALDKTTHKAIFFETSQMVWTEMVNQEKKGIKIFDYDWLIERTENKPKYYEITRLEKDPLDELDSKAYAEAKELDLKGLADYKMGVQKTQSPEEPPVVFDEAYIKSMDKKASEQIPDDLTEAF